MKKAGICDEKTPAHSAGVFSDRKIFRGASGEGCPAEGRGKGIAAEDAARCVWDPLPPARRPAGNTKTVPTNKLNTALIRDRTLTNLLPPPLQKGGGMGIISPWCSCETAVLSGLVTRTGPPGVASARRPAAFMFPVLILNRSGGKCKGIYQNHGDAGF